MSEEYRIALRPYDVAAEGPGWKAALDDIVVNDVSMFRMEDMGTWFFMCCYLNGEDDGDRIAFAVRRGRKGEPHIVVLVTEAPDVVYEAGSVHPSEP